LRKKERPVLAGVLLKFLVRTNLSNVTIDQHHNRTRSTNRVVAVCGEDDDLLVSKGSQQLEDLAFAYRVEARAWLIEDD